MGRGERTAIRPVGLAWTTEEKAAAILLSASSATGALSPLAVLTVGKTAGMGLIMVSAFLLAMFAALFLWSHVDMVFRQLWFDLKFMWSTGSTEAHINAEAANDKHRHTGSVDR